MLMHEKINFHFVPSDFNVEYVKRVGNCEILSTWFHKEPYIYRAYIFSFPYSNSNMIPKCHSNSLVDSAQKWFKMKKVALHNKELK